MLPDRETPESRRALSQAHQVITSLDLRETLASRTELSAKASKGHHNDTMAMGGTPRNGDVSYPANTT